MPSMQHEVLVELFKNRPSLAAELLHEVFDETIPPYDAATVVSADITQIKPAEYRQAAAGQLWTPGSVRANRGSD